MPELTPEKVAKIDALFRSKGRGSVYDEANREAMLAKFVDKEPDPEVKRRNFAALKPPGLVAFEESISRPAEPGDETGGASFKGGLPGKIVGSFATGVQEAIKPVGELFAKLPGTKIVKWGLEKSGVPIGEKYKEYEHLVRQGQEAAGNSGAAGKYSRIAGNIAPMLAIPGAAFSTPARMAGTGALIGVAGTEGGLGERAKAGAFGALSFGIAGKANRLLNPVMQKATGALLARGIPLKFLPRLAHAATDASAFTSVAALEQEIAPHPDQAKASIAELFLTNFATIAMAHGMGAALPKEPGAKFAKGRQIVTLKKGMAEQEGGLGALNIARKEALEAGHDAALVHAAYMEAARGRGITPAEAQIMARGGSKALRAKIAPERVADLFAEDQPGLAPEPVAAEIGVNPSDKAKVIYEAQAATARAITEAAKARADAVVEAQRLRTMAGQMDAEARRQTEVAAKAAAQVAIHGGKPPVVTAAIDALNPLRPVGDTATKVAKLEADATRLEDLASRMERQAGAEETIPAQRALDAPTVTASTKGPKMSDLDAIQTIEANNLNTLKKAHDYLFDERSHGDEYAAAAASKVWKEMFTKPPEEASKTSPETIRDYVSRVVEQAATERAADEAPPTVPGVGTPELPRREPYDPNVAKKIRLRASELRDQATALREQGFAEEAKTTAPGVTPKQPVLPDFETPAAAAKKWADKAADARRRADEIELRAETEYDFSLDRAKRLRQRIRGMDPEGDAVAKILPSDSVGSRKLRDTTAEDAIVTVKRLSDEGVAIAPDQPINIRPGGTKALADDLARTPPEQPGSDFDRFNASSLAPGDPPPAQQRAAAGPNLPADIKAPKPWDYFRMLQRTATKLLGPDLGRKLYEMAVEASWKTRHVKHTIRKAAASHFRKYRAWLDVLTPADQQAAIDRFVNLTEQGITQGAHPVETQFLTFWHRVMKGYANAAEIASGKPMALKGRYLSHVFETLDASNDPAARRAARQILDEWQGGPKARQPGGSRFLHARLSSRKDFVRDVFFLFDAYVNSMTPALHWKPVANWIAELRAPGGAFETIMAEKMKATGGDIKEAKRLRSRMQATEEFLKKHVAAGMGRQESWWGIADALDAGIANALSRIGFKPKAPYRTLMRAYTYAQYVGGLGLNVGSALRNLTQNINTISEVGPTWWAKAATLLAEVGAGGRPDVNRLLRQAHINDTALERDVRTNVQSLFGRNMSTLGRGVADVTMGLFTGAEWLDRSTAYLAGYLKAKSRGLPEAKARAFAREILGKTQFDYSPGLGGLIYNGPFTHALFQFTRFPIYQMDWLGSVIGRAVSGKPSGLPGDNAVSPALRLAISSLVASPLMAALALDFNDSFGIGGVPEPVKFAATRGAEEIGRQFGGFEGSMAGRRAMRRVGLEPYETTIGEATKRLMGPIAQQGDALLDFVTGTPEERHFAAKDLKKNFTVLMPGLAVHRLLRFMEENDDQQVRNTRTGEVMFPITEGDSWKRLVGINSPNVIEGYERIRDQTIRENAADGMRAILYDDAREEYRKVKASGDPDAAARMVAKYLSGWKEIFIETGVVSKISAEDAFDRNVRQKVEIGDATTREQRMKPVIDRSDLIGKPGGR